MADARHRRITAVRERLVELHLDGLLVSSLPNVRYLTGFSGSNALLLVTSRDLLLLTDFRYESQVAAEVGDLARIRIELSSLWAGFWEALRGADGLNAVGFESAHLMHRDFQRLLEEGDRWAWRPTVDVIEGLRERKDAGEVAAIRRAATVAQVALESTLREVRVGLSERQVAGLLERNLREAGADDFPFPTIVAAGERSALPHARAGSRAIALGDLLLLDFGAICDGYCADITRTVVMGTASERQREVHQAVREANRTAREGVRAGLRGKDADAIARELLAARGFGEAFGHGLGHGLGLEVHEAPRLSRVSESVLPEGAVVTIEPGVYLPGWGGVRIEDDVHLGADGPEVLTDFPRELLELA
ncbi:MAG TPA: Xaa-Pro peptidase family protein [Gemmatimonadaceae bacterium]|nr:Xaa-Pro peptidase family protein [Gemmatimonadaceae bacterium]